MKKNILTIAGLLLLLVLIPLTVNAASIEVDKTEMEVKDTVTVTVTVDTADVEAIQFDLKFDNTKYRYVLNSAESKLDSTASNLIADDIVRASAYNFDENETTQVVTLKFEATNAGTSVPFSVVDGTVETTDKNNVVEMEAFAEPEVKVNKIEKKEDEKNPDNQYVDENGNPIIKHPDTGKNNSTRTAVKSIAGIYNTLISNTPVVPYALATSDDILTVEDVKAEFGDTVTGLTNPVKTGDVFDVNGKQYTILIYGDVNCDGKVTTADALMIRKYELNKITLPTEVQELAANVAKDEDSKPVQQFVLRLRETTTDTILDAYPIEFTVNDIKVTATNNVCLRGEKTLIANISTTNGGIITTDLLDIVNPENVVLSYEVKADGSIDIYAVSNNGATFEIKPVLTGSVKLQNGKIEKENQAITVKDVTSVTEIVLIDEDGNEVSDEIYMLPGGEKALSIKYYHTYSDGSRVPLTENEIMLNRNLVKLEIAPNNILDDSKTGLAVDNNMSTDGFLNNLFLTAKTGVSDIVTVKVSVDNDSNLSSTAGYIANCEKTITVDISYPVVTDIELNGTKVTSSYDVNLYKTAQPNNNSVKLLEDSSNGTSAYYSIVDVNLLTNRNTKLKVTGNMCTQEKNNTTMNDENSLIISEVASPDSQSYLCIAFFRKVGNTYEKVEDLTAEVDAIGFSYYDLDYYDDDISELEQGVTIYFGGTTDSTGKVTKKSITLNIIGEKDPVSAPNKAPQLPQQPVEDDEPGTNEPSVEPDEDKIVDTATPTTTPSATVEPTETPEPTTTPEPTEVPTETPVTTPEPTPNTTPDSEEVIPPVEEDDDVLSSDHREPTIDENL